MVTEKSEKLDNIIDKDLAEMVKYIKKNPRLGFNNSKKFHVFTLETSRGKTSGSCNALIDEIKSNGAFGTRIIFVSKMKDECVNFVKRINEETNSSYAVAYIPSGLENEKEKDSNATNDFSVCLTKKIITLTHSMYLRLSIANTERYIKMKQALEDNFNTLIIDEQIDNINSTYATFSINDYNQVLNLFKTHKELKKIYKKICQPLCDLIENNYFKDALTHRAAYTDELEGIDYIIDKECETINAFIDEKIIEESLEDYEIDSNYITTKSDLKKFIDDIRLFYYEIENNNVLINSEYSTIYTYYSEFEFLKLKNNIWLDASAKFNSLYKLNSEFFEVIDSKRIIDHSNCNFYYHRENTSKSNKSRNDITKFRKDKMKFILQNTKSNSKVLILTSKTECIQLEKKHIDEELQKKIKEIKFYNFDNMRGVNDCSDFTYCYILQTPRRQIPYYIFAYEYWTGTKLTDSEMETSKINGNEDWGFKNHKELQKLMIDDIASSLYQGCKRIARSSEPNGYFHVFNKIDKAVLIVLKQLKNINNNKDGKLTDYNNSKRLKKSEKGKYKKWLSEWDGSPIKINDIKKKFKFSDDNWDYSNRDKSIKEIKQHRNIICSKIKGNGNDYYFYIKSFNEESNITDSASELANKFIGIITDIKEDKYLLKTWVNKTGKKEKQENICVVLGEDYIVKKKCICDLLGIDKINKVLEDHEVKKFISENDIKFQGQKVIFH